MNHLVGGLVSKDNLLLGVAGLPHRPVSLNRSAILPENSRNGRTKKPVQGQQGQVAEAARTVAEWQLQTDRKPLYYHSLCLLQE